MAKVKAPVEFRNVSKRYGAVTAVDDVSFRIAPGTLVTLLGPSGCGKTTTLRLIAGLEMASAGRIFIGDEDVTALSAADRDVSMVFQSYALFPHMSVLENVAYGPSVQGYKKPEAEAMAAEKIRLVGLSGLEKRAPSELSGGQQQRVAVARALVLEPKVLLFDEPLSNLDAKLRRRVRDDIRQLQTDLALTVAYVTHDQEEALAVSDEIIVMSNAKIAQIGTPHALYEEPSNLFVADFIGDANIVDALLMERNATRATIQIGDAMLNLPHRGAQNGPVKIAARPDALILSRGGEGLSGTVTKSSYLGKVREYTVKTSIGDLFITAPGRSEEFLPRSEVVIRFADSGIVVLPN
jgi:iron(III) transport system ATP-binding protein